MKDVFEFMQTNRIGAYRDSEDLVRYNTPAPSDEVQEKRLELKGKKRVTAAVDRVHKLSSEMKSKRRAA